jgi:nucleotide-binding universal stress UspA family protein
MYERVLVALDGSESSERIVSWLRRVLGGSGATLHLVTVKAPPEALRADDGRTVTYVDQAEDQVRAEGLDALQPVASRLAEDGFVVVPAVRFGEPARTLLAAARELDVDLIALATRGVGGVRRLWTKSVTREVLREASVPVLVARRSAQRAA